MRFEVTILGNGSASPAADKHQTAHVLNVREQFYLIDCGEGTRSRLLRVGVSPLKIRAVFISHIHGDHIYGLVPLISSLGLAGKQTPLKIFGPGAVGRMLDFFQNEFGQPVDFELDFTPVDTTAHRLVYENRSMEVWSVPLRHRTPTTGYHFVEKPDPHNHPTRSYAYLSDTLPSPKAAGLVRGVDLMYHEATFAHTDRRLARDTGHSTATEAARIALKAGAGELIIGHFSSRYKNLALLEDEARAVFPNTRVAAEGATFSVPLKKADPGL
ncbi:MAG: ribonuclease Z [Alistipes sp.]|nr:ribonuclease Z [Alistipes sp.]